MLKAAGIPARYFCRRSLVTWDVLLPSEDLAKKLSASNITSKFNRLQPEYKGDRKIKGTVCNVPIQLNGDVLAAYLSEYGDIEDITTSKSSSGTVHGDYLVNMSLDRRGFQAIPQTIEYEEQTMMVVVEGRKPQCWFCKQLGHFSRFCPQKTTTTTATTVTTTEKITKPTKDPQTESENDPDKEKEGWTQVTSKKSPVQKVPSETTAITKPSTSSSSKTIKTTEITTATTKSSSSRTSKVITNNAKTSSSSSTSKEKQEKMDFAVNLKRRRDSGDSQVEGGSIKKTSPKFTNSNTLTAVTKRKKIKSPAPIQ